MKVLAVDFLLVIGFLGASFSRSNLPVHADIMFRNATVENMYPKELIFRVEICGRPSGSHVIFNYMEYRLDTWSEETRTMDDGRTPDGCYKLKYFLETRDLYIPPFSPIKYFWSVTEEANIISQSFNYVYIYKNEGYTWKNLENGRLIIWWHDRSDSFIQDAMSIATRAFNDQAKFYSYSLKSPITIVIANTSDEFFAWQPRKNNRLNGMAFPEIFLTIQLIEDNTNYYHELNDVIPHEISHIYFAHLMKKDAGPPRWLDEGLATYNEYSDHWGRWMVLKSAYARGETIPLKELEDNFGEDPQKIDVAYAESYYAILYMDEVYGKDAIAMLLDEYRKGTSTTAAFEKSFGKDPESFESDFMVWLDERLKTPPPNNDLPQFVSGDRQVEVFALAGVLCLGGLCITAAGIIFIAILVRHNSNRAREINEVEVHRQSEAND